MKKVFYFSLAFLILVLIFLGAYNFIFRNNVNDPTVDQGKKAEAVKEKTTETVQAISSILPSINESVMGVVIGSNDFLYYYSFDDKALKKATLEGKDKVVLMSNLPGTPTRILWSPKKDKALLFLKQENGKSLWHFAELNTKTLVPLKEEISRIAWDNLGEKIFYQYTDLVTQERTLNSANPDGTGWKKLTVLNFETFIAPVPKSMDVAFWSRPNAFESTSLFRMNFSGDNRKSLLAEKFGADYLWSPNGEKILVSMNSEKGGKAVSLGIMNASGGELKDLMLPTLISKVVWSRDSKTIYYALPGSIPENSVLPNDYFEKPVYTKDTFWKMDITTGKKARLTELKEVTQGFDSIDLGLSSKEDTLFFTDRSTKRLYRIDL
ncbi:MAG: hypothetical protein COZ27_00685 [Candidatus Moranbacteria bacterium CG_4_10_14_3_um_filter_41_65]|nr:MAG: hypothetical protein AUK58_01685 [Candidatus Moranbacteria bacterium CG2_30_41_165]PIX91833.1 MAG: hypothetical protein COZ27_00685 [Candidatus Moranbacteria bacterium CG_4_10_14_3_um_filter_41_65]HCJ45791.1 hypothetical protein [Candidatus Moranbacteria bacterium]